MSLTVRDIGFSRNGTPILRKVGFTMEPGQFVAVAGPNGVGKTTLIRLLLRFLAPATGDIRLFGRALNDYSRPELAKLLAYVPQGMPGLFPMSVLDLVLMGRRPHLSWRPSGRDYRAAALAMRRLGIEDLAERSIEGLSGGQAQKALIARALAQDTPCLFLDEPTSNLDLRHQVEVMELLRSLAREKSVCVLASMHDVNMAKRYADKALLLDKGRTYGFGAPEDILHERSLREVYGVEVAKVVGGGFTGYFPIKPSEEEG